MKKYSVVICLFGLSGATLTALLKTTKRPSVSRNLSRPLRKISTATAIPVASGSTVLSGAMFSGNTLSNIPLNSVGALSNLSSKTTGNTAISLDGSAFTPGATIAVGSNNAVQGAQQVTSNVLGGSNAAMVSGYSGNVAAAKSAVSGLSGGASSGVSNILNETTGDFTFNMNGGGSGNVGSLILENGSTVIGGMTTTGVVGGTTNNSSILREPVSFVQPS